MSAPSQVNSQSDATLLQQIPQNNTKYMGPRSGNNLIEKCQLCISAFKWLPVIFISSVLGWGYYAYVIQLCYFNITSVILKVVFLVVFHFLFIMTFWSYFQTIFTRPRAVPKKFWFTVTDNERFSGVGDRRNQVIQQIANEKGLPIQCRDSLGAVRICVKCNIFKPDRAHHCSACNRCVLKMDHHCPWVNNCVSFSNYKYFVLFLGYSFLLCSFTGATTIQYFLQFWRNTLTSDSKFHVLFLFFVSVMFAVSLVSLFGYHIYLLSINRSTVESFRPPIFRMGPDRNAYNLGKYRNCIQIFGPVKWKWLFPVYTSLGDGIVYSSRMASPSDCESGLAQSKNTGAFLLNDTTSSSNSPFSSGHRNQETASDQMNKTSTSPSDANFYKTSSNGESSTQIRDNKPNTISSSDQNNASIGLLSALD